MRTTSKVLMMYAIDTVMRNTALQTRDTKTSIRWDSRSQCYGFAKIKLSKLRWFNFLLLTWFCVYCIHTSTWKRELYVLEFIDVERTMWEFVPGPGCSPRTVSAISHQDISVSSNIFSLHTLFMWVLTPDVHTSKSPHGQLTVIFCKELDTSDNGLREPWN